MTEDELLERSNSDIPKGDYFEGELDEPGRQMIEMDKKVEKFEVEAKPERMGYPFVGTDDKFDAEVATEVCAHLAVGGTLKDFIAEKGVNRGTVAMWTLLRPDFGEAYLMAHKARMLLYIEDLFTLMRQDTQKMDNMVEISGWRAKTDVIKWMAGKAMPKLYGENVIADVFGAAGDDMKPVINITFEKKGKETDEEEQEVIDVTPGT